MRLKLSIYNSREIGAKPTSWFISRGITVIKISLRVSSGRSMQEKKTNVNINILCEHGLLGKFCWGSSLKLESRDFSQNFWRKKVVPVYLTERILYSSYGTVRGLVWCCGGGVDKYPRQCPGVVNESRGMTDTPKPAASPSSSHPTAGPVGPTCTTGLSPSDTTFTLPRLFSPGHQLGLCYAVKQMTGGMHIVFGAIHPWCRPSQPVEGRGTSHAQIVWPLLQWEMYTIQKPFCPTLKRKYTRKVVNEILG